MLRLLFVCSFFHQYYTLSCFAPTLQNFSLESGTHITKEIRKGHIKLMCEALCAQLQIDKKDKHAKLNTCGSFAIDEKRKKCFLYEAMPITLAPNKSDKATLYMNNCTKEGAELIAIQDKIAVDIMSPTELQIHKKKHPINSLFGLEDIISQMLNNVSTPLKYPHLFSGITSPHKGVLLYGPPGNGKTVLVNILASNTPNIYYMPISMSAISSSYTGESEKLVRLIFSIAEELSPCIVFLDEIDSFLSTRNKNGHEITQRVKNEFLIGMDGINSKKTNKKIIIIGATNFPQNIDDAALRRLPLRYHLRLPETVHRKKIIQSICTIPENASGEWQKFAPLLSEIKSKDMDIIVEKTSGFSSKDIFDLIGDVFDMILNPTRTIITRKPTTEDFINALKRRRSSVKDESIIHILEWERKKSKSK